MPHRPTSRREVVAYVAPFIIYVVPAMLESKGWFAFQYETVCTLKGVIAAAALWVFRRHYPPLATKGCGLAIIAGVAGCVVWILFDRLQAAIPGLQSFLNGLVGSRAGYDPFAGGGSATIRTAFVIVRVIEMAAIVPVLEEVFWRGFLARYLLADDFQDAPQGVFTPSSFIIVTLAFASVHPEILAAIAWGALINLLYRRTANLWACVAMHSVTNGLLCGYILTTGNWQLW